MKVDFLNLQDSRIRYMVAAVVLAMATIVTAFAPTLVGADQLTARSIAMSNSSAASTAVQYDVSFTASAGAQAVVLDFCSDSPLIGNECVKPTGLSLTGVTSAGSTAVDINDEDGILTIDRTIDAGTNTFSVNGITNPADAATMYVRILTYANATSADGYTSEAPGSVLDTGSVALAITNTVGVSGAVLETLTFCVAKKESPIAANCGDANNPGNEPVLTLGTETSADSGVYALNPGEVHTGVLQTQITTNASGGAVVRLKSDATDCGGLLRLGSDPMAARCIEPATAQATDGSAEFFGVITNAASVNGTFGTLAPVTLGDGVGYDNATYRMNYVGGNGSGVTGVLGDPFLTTGGAPVADANMGITFGAAATAQTPAGTYAADLRMIATGTF